MKIKNFNNFLNEGVEDDKRLSDPIVKILNDQIKNELQSSQIYRGMACWLDDAKWVSASKYFFKSGQEELIHMDKIYNYLFDKNCLAKVPTCDEVEQSFKSIRQVVEKSLEHEIGVTENWEEIAELAKKEGDNTTYEFSQWFLKEQVEEEDKFRDILFKMDKDMPDWQIEEMFEDLNDKG